MHSVGVPESSRCVRVGVVDPKERVAELEALVRRLSEENERLREEVARLRRDRDERPPHYL